MDKEETIYMSLSELKKTRYAVDCEIKTRELTRKIIERIDKHPGETLSDLNRRLNRLGNYPLKWVLVELVESGSLKAVSSVHKYNGMKITKYYIGSKKHWKSCMVSLVRGLS